MDEMVMFEIIEGPDRLALFSAIAQEQPVTFKVRNQSGTMFSELVVRVSAIELESGGGHCWNIKGWSHGDSNGKLLGNFTGFYKTDGKPHWKDTLGTLNYSIKDEW